MRPHCTIIGAQGFLGSAMVRVAQKRGYQVLAVNRDNFEECRGTRTDLLIDANGNSRKYLAEKSPEKDFELSVRSVMHTLCSFQASCYLYLSTMEVYADTMDPCHNREIDASASQALSPYGFHKSLAEQLVRYHAPAWLILRLAGFCGPGLSKNGLYDLLRGDQMFLHPDSRCQYMHTDDLAGIAFSLYEAQHRNKAINVAGEGTISLREAARWISGRCFTPADESLHREDRELNIEQLRSIMPVPQTEPTVREFIKQVLAGEVETA